MNFVLPPKSQVGVLDAEIAGEGQKIILSDGEVVEWNPSAAAPVMPDWSKIKSIARYFGRTGHSVWPAWVYHPTEAPRLLKNANEGIDLGIVYREATDDERNRYGHKAVWDWQDECQWRPQPYKGTLAFNAARPDHGKNVIIGAPNPVHAQNDLVRMLIPEVAAAVAAALKGSGPGAPANINPADWEEFQQFLAFKKSSEAVTALSEASDDEPEEPQGNALALTPTGITEEQERSVLIEEAQERGIKVDKRWGNDRLKQEIDKAA